MLQTWELFGRLRQKTADPPNVRLINYTPQATIVRLLTIDVINAYLTLETLSLSGGFQDPRLLLPGWIGIATVRLLFHHLDIHRMLKRLTRAPLRHSQCATTSATNE